LAQIDIALPTYNKAPWLDAFMDSLLAQDHADWRIVARDDCSLDGTAACLASWQARLGSRLVILSDSGAGNLGVIGSYNTVLANTTTPWVMTADADDVWLPSKIAMTLKAALSAEMMSGPATPIAVCTDAKVVDGNLRPVAASYWRWCRMDPRLASNLPRVAMESVALGSTMIVNRALLDLALPMPPGANYQDCWFAMVAAAFGRIIPLPIQTVLYRRHQQNLTSEPYGASILGALGRALRQPLAPRRRVHSLILKAATQASAFVENYRERLDPENLSALDALASLPSLGPAACRLAIARHGLWFGSPVKNITMFAMI